MRKLSFIQEASSLEAFENASDYVDVRALSANVAKTFNKPTGSAKLLFSANLVAGDVVTFGSSSIAEERVTLTAVASAAGASEFVPGATLALTLAAMVTKLQALAPGRLPAGTFTVTDTNTSITFTNSKDGVPIIANARLASATATYSKVDGARFVRLSAGQLFYYAIGITATTGPADISNGLGSISVPATVQPWFNVDDVSTISVIAPQACTVSAEWWG